MGHLARIQEYRKRRHRAALRRRGYFASRDIPEPCRGSGAFLRLMPENPTEGEIGFQAVLAGLAQKLFAYPGVAGLLYRRKADTAEIHIVAPRPMTRPMKLLAATWVEGLKDLYPLFRWIVRVNATPPEDVEGYRCLFWHRG